MPKLSIITVSYNSQKTIEDTLRSLRAQTCRDFEHIVIDGGSTDQTLTILEAYRDQVNVLVSGPDKGIYDAMDKGLRLASGDFVGYLNSDDYFASPDAVRQLTDRLTQTGADCVWGDVVHVLENGVPTRYMSGAIFNPRWFRFGIMPPHPTFYARREALLAAGGFNAKFRIAGDFDIMVKLFKQEGFRGTYLPRAITAMRVGGVSTAGLKATAISSRELLVALSDNSIPASQNSVRTRYLFKVVEKIRGIYMRLRGRRFAPPSAA